MTYGHVKMLAAIPAVYDEALADDLLALIARHPAAGHGVYVIAVAEQPHQAQHLAAVAIRAVRVPLAAL